MMQLDIKLNPSRIQQKLSIAFLMFIGFIICIASIALAFKCLLICSLLVFVVINQLFWQYLPWQMYFVANSNQWNLYIDDEPAIICKLQRIQSYPWFKKLYFIDEFDDIYTQNIWQDQVSEVEWRKLAVICRLKNNF